MLSYRRQTAQDLAADDMQGHCTVRPTDATAIVSRLKNCAKDVSDWCAAKRLQ